MAARPLTILCLNKNYFVEELRSFGHTVITASPPENQSLTYDEATSSRRFDIAFSRNSELKELLARVPPIERLVYFDDSNPDFYLKNLQDCPVPSLLYSIDAHIHHNRHPHFCGMFDRVLVAQKDFVAKFAAYQPAAYWFPLWAPLTFEPCPEKSIDVCFRGSLTREHRPKRVAFLERLSKLIKIDAQVADYAEAFCRARIILNETISGDVNFRVFEAMMCGGMLLTPRTSNGLTDLFEPGIDLVTYQDDNEAEAAEKIKYYLAHEKERARIAANGRKKILAHHTALIRARQFEEHLLALEKTPRLEAQYCSAALELLRLSLELKEAQKRFPLTLASIALRLLSVAAKRPSMSQELTDACLRCANLFREHGLYEQATEFVTKLHSCHPEDQLLPGLLISLHQESKRPDLARLIAEKNFADCEQALSVIPPMFKKLYESLAL